MKKSILHSTSLVSANKLLSLGLGFVRDLVWAHMFGASVAFDAFIIAFHLPSFLVYILSEAGLRQVCIPLLSEKQAQPNNEADIKEFLSQLSAIFFLILTIIVILSLCFAPSMIKIFAPGFTEAETSFHLTVSLFRIMAIGIFFSSVAGLYSAILNTVDSFGIPSLVPIVFNIFAIVSSIYFTGYFDIPIYALAWGILLGNVFQLLLQAPFLLKKNLLVMPSLHINKKMVVKIFKMVAPALAGVSIVQLGVLIDFMFSSYLPNGSITWLYYSTRLMEVPVGIFSVSIATVALPYLSRYYAKNDGRSYHRLLEVSFRSALLAGIPSSIGLFVLAGPILTTLFGHGFFTQHDVLMATQSTKAFAIGICGFTIATICATAFYARQDIKFPAKVSGIALLCNIIFNFIFFKTLAHAGLALATSLSGLINAAILFTYLVSKKYYQPEATLLLYISRLMIASLVMLLVLHQITPHLDIWFAASISWRISHLGLDILIGSITYFLALKILGLRLTYFVNLYKDIVFTKNTSESEF